MDELLSLTLLAGLTALQASSSAYQPGDLKCDFESSCEWIEWDRFWIVTKGNATGGQSRYMPSVDHTYRNASGHFLYLNGSNIEASVFTSEVNFENKSKCFEFYHFTNGSGFHALTVTLDAGTLHETWLNLSAPNRTVWQRAIMELPEDTYSIHVRANVSLDNGVVAIDDIRLFGCEKNGSWPSPPAEPLLRCDFEGSSCMFTNDRFNDFDWTWSEAGQAHKEDESRPMVDHTTGTAKGYYSYAESYSTQGEDKDGWLVTFDVDVPFNNYTYCSELYYYQYGQGSLHVYNYSSEQYLDEITNATLNRNKAGWTRLVFPLSTPGKFRLVISVVTSLPRTRVRVAIDDVRVYMCPFVKKVPDPSVRFLYEMDCDFEHSMCGLQSQIDHTATWRRVNATNTSLPSAGHPTPGYVLLFEIVETTLPETSYDALVVSNPIIGRSNWCVDFYYFLYNTSNASEVEDPLTLVVTQSGQSVFSKGGEDMKNEWQHARNVPIFAEAKQQLVFAATARIKNAVIAIDDVKIGQCTVVSPTTSLSTSPATYTIATTITESAPPVTTSVAMTTTLEQTTSMKTQSTTHGSASLNTANVLVLTVSFLTCFATLQATSCSAIDVTL